MEKIHVQSNCLLGEERKMKKTRGTSGDEPANGKDAAASEEHQAKNSSKSKRQARSADSGDSSKANLSDTSKADIAAASAESKRKGPHTKLSEGEGGAADVIELNEVTGESKPRADHRPRNQRPKTVNQQSDSDAGGKEADRSDRLKESLSGENEFDSSDQPSSKGSGKERKPKLHTIAASGDSRVEEEGVRSKTKKPRSFESRGGRGKRGGPGSTAKGHEPRPQVSNTGSNALPISSGEADDSTLTLTLSKALVSKLRRSAKEEGVDIETLGAELLAEGVVLRAWEIIERKSAMRGGNSTQSQQGNSHRGSHSGGNHGGGNHSGGNSRRGRGNSSSGNNNRRPGNNNAWMEDKAAFLEYVRNQEKRRR